MKNVYIWVIVVLLIAAGLFWYMNRPAEETPATQDQETPVTQDEETPQSMVVALSTQNASGVSGTATLTEMNGSTLVKLDLAGSPEDVAQPAHIHTGSCAEIGDVVYSINSPVNGMSETTLAVSLDTILAGLPLALNVHKSEAEVSVYVACGDLR